MKFTFYSDYHLFTPIALPNDLPIDAMEISKQNVYLLGDIFDRKGCNKKDELNFKIQFSNARNLFGTRYINGNHELQEFNQFIKVGKILITHGHCICWSEEKRSLFLNSEPFSGFGIFKRSIDCMRHVWKQSINNFEVEQATKYCKQSDCDTIVYGHSHTNKLLIKKVNGITIYNVPRGKIVLDL